MLKDRTDAGERLVQPLERERRVDTYRHGRPLPPLEDQTTDEEVLEILGTYADKSGDRSSVPAHLFEEPGALEEVGRTAGDWFVRWMPDTGIA